MVWRWIRAQYNDIKGNLKWAIVSWFLLGGGLTWLAHWLQAVSHANIAGWLALAAPIFSILAVLYLLLVISPGIDAAASSHTETAAALPLYPPRLAQPPSLPLPVDLRGEILELYFHDPDHPLMFVRMHILLKVSIVNHGPDQATIPSCKLEVRLPGFQRTADVTDPPPGWRIKRQEQGLLGPVSKEDPIAPHLTQHDTYLKGIPHVGWMAFEFYNAGHPSFPNAEFTIHLQDSLGGCHQIRRGPMAYEPTGEIVVANDSHGL